jgi:hypothetical protein
VHDNGLMVQIVLFHSSFWLRQAEAAVADYHAAAARLTWQRATSFLAAL